MMHRINSCRLALAASGLLMVAAVSLACGGSGNLDVLVQDENGTYVTGAIGDLFNSCYVQLTEQTTQGCPATAVWQNLAAGSYSVEAYVSGQYWGVGSAVVVEGETTSLTISRAEPYVSNFTVQQGGADVTGGVVPVGATVTDSVTVKNPHGTARTVQVLLWVSRTQTSPFDLAASSSPLTIPAGGSTVYSVTQTLSNAGEYFRQIQVIEAVNGKQILTDQRNWGLAVVASANPAGGLRVTVKDQTGAAVSGAVVERYDNTWAFLDRLTTQGTPALAAWPNVAPGSYWLEAYFNGEYWGAVNTTVTGGATDSVTISRAEPYASGFSVTQGCSAAVPPGGTVMAGAQLTDSVTVQNPSGAAQCVRVLLWVSRSEVSPYDFTATSRFQAIPAGGTAVYNFTEVASAAGAYFRMIQVQVCFNGKQLLTDQWNWAAAFTVGSAHTLAVQSSPIAGVLITGVPSPYSGKTNYSVQVQNGVSVTLTAPSTAVGADENQYTFSNWTVNGTVQPTGRTSVTLLVNMNTTAVAVYAMSGMCSSIRSNFSGTAVPGGSYLWFNSVCKINGVGAKPVTVNVTGAQITFSVNGNLNTLNVPDGQVIVDPKATVAATSFTGGRWCTTVPAGLSGNTFLAGIPFKLSGKLPGGIGPVTWSACFSADTSGVSIQWQWSAAACASFSDNGADLGVKPCDSGTASVYRNSDRAGTPEKFKAKVVGGATGGGGSNYTGSLGATATVTP